MADKKVVSLNAKIREMLKREAKANQCGEGRKGGFYLAMLAQTSPELPNGLTLATSVPWTVEAGFKQTVRYFSDRLREWLTKSELSAFDRIAILDPREPLVQGIQRRTDQSLDSGQEGYEITHSSFGGVAIPYAFVFEAHPHPDRAARKPRQSGKTAAVAVR
jgi:hypothetical protein